MPWALPSKHNIQVHLQGLIQRGKSSILKEQKHVRLPFSYQVCKGLEVVTPVLTRKKLNKLSISSSWIHHGLEATGKTAAPNVGEAGAGQAGSPIQVMGLPV